MIRFSNMFTVELIALADGSWAAHAEQHGIGSLASTSSRALQLVHLAIKEDSPFNEELISLNHNQRINSAAKKSNPMVQKNEMSLERGEKLYRLSRPGHHSFQKSTYPTPTH